MGNLQFSQVKGCIVYQPHTISIILLSKCPQCTDCDEVNLRFVHRHHQRNSGNLRQQMQLAQHDGAQPRPQISKHNFLTESNMLCNQYQLPIKITNHLSVEGFYKEGHSTCGKHCPQGVPRPTSSQSEAISIEIGQLIKIRRLIRMAPLLNLAGLSTTAGYPMTRVIQRRTCNMHHFGLVEKCGHTCTTLTKGRILSCLFPQC